MTKSARSFLFWLMAALAVRAGAAALASERLKALEGEGFGKDGAAYYDPLVDNLLSGNGYCVTVGHPSATHVPGYPLILSGARRILGSRELSPKIVQVVSGALVVGLVFLLARRILGARAAHVSAALALFSPDLAAYSLFNLSDMPYLVLFLCAGLLVCSVMKTESLRTAGLLGLVLGAGTLTRESAAGLILIWPVTLALLRNSAGRRRMKAAACIVAMAILAMAPWWIRNYRVFNLFLPLTTKGAVNIYIATVIRPYRFTGYLSPEAGPEWPSNAREEAVRERLSKTSDFHERNGIYLRAALENILVDPGGQIVHVGRKLMFLLQPNIGPRHAGRTGLAPILWGAAGAYGLLWILGLVGLWRLRSRSELMVASVLPAGYFLLAHLLVGDAEPRYLLPVLPALMMGAGDLVTSWRGRAPAAILAAEGEG
jgi:4-amino-4-deoxy-L-arabinose transferase-like glycosyltransferase